MTVKEIDRLYKKYYVPPNVREHMKKVKKVAEFLALHINKNEGKRLVRINLLKKAAQIHDIFKACDFCDSSAKNYKIYSVCRSLRSKYGNIGHISLAERFLYDIGEQELARIVARHDYSCVADPDPKMRPVTIEEKLLYYADKRVLHNSVVSLSERFIDGRKRYGSSPGTPGLQSAIELAARRLERDICKMAGIRPGDIK